MRIAAVVPPSTQRVGAAVATHRFLSHLATRGHVVNVVSSLHDDVSSMVADADVVVSHLGATTQAATLAAHWGKPNVRMAHGMITDPALLEGAALVVFNSHNLAGSVVCPSPWIVCHPPADADAYRTTPGTHITLINLSEHKGGELFWRLVRCAPTRRFLGVQGAYGNQYIEHAHNAEVIGTTDNMRDDVYARTRILLMPSERETWGMTAIEAAASGIPTIAHPTEGLVESLGDAGIYVDRDDGQGWLDAIHHLDDIDHWRHASTRARARCADVTSQGADDLDRFAHHISEWRAP